MGIAHHVGLRRDLDDKAGLPLGERGREVVLRVPHDLREADRSPRSRRPAGARVGEQALQHAAQPKAAVKDVLGVLLRLLRRRIRLDQDLGESGDRAERVGHVVGRHRGEAIQLLVGPPKRLHRLLELLLGTLALGQVAGDLREAPQLAALVPQGGEDGVGPEARTVLAQPPPLVLATSSQCLTACGWVYWVLSSTVPSQVSPVTLSKMVPSAGFSV